MIKRKGERIQKQDDLEIEEKIEEDKNKLRFQQGTPVTLERFLKWIEDKKKKKEIEIEKKVKEA